MEPEVDISSGKKVVESNMHVFLSNGLFQSERSEIVKVAIKKVLTDRGFQIPTVAAKDAQKAAEKVLEWATDPTNNSSFGTFASNIIAQLESCFVGDQRSIKGYRENMWERISNCVHLRDLKPAGLLFLLKKLVCLLVRFFSSMS